MPAQKKKKDSVTRNMEARYAPVEGSLRSKPIQSRIDVSGSTSAPPPVFFSSFFSSMCSSEKYIIRNTSILIRFWNYS
eukprot:NP_001355491.1 Uncharacterized protein CELE_M163.21 [Caenorhabditis elegans]